MSLHSLTGTDINTCDTDTNKMSDVRLADFCETDETSTTAQDACSLPYTITTMCSLKSGLDFERPFFFLFLHILIYSNHASL